MECLILRIRDGRDKRSLYHCLRVQKKDQSLEKLWLYVQEASEMKTKGGTKCRYVIQRGVLYREYEQVRGYASNFMKQVVVPSEHRKWVMSLAK